MTKTTDPRKPSRHELYFTWKGMLARCYKPNQENYKRYGALGIEVCQRWQDDFWDFVADVGPRPVGHTLDRVDNDGNYEPSNCRWSTVTEQNRNKRDKSDRVLVAGKSVTIRELSNETGVDVNLIRMRVRANIKANDVGLQPGQIAKRYVYNGERHTLRSLGNLAGITGAGMARRLKTMSVEEAVRRLH